MWRMAWQREKELGSMMLILSLLNQPVPKPMHFSYESKIISCLCPFDPGFLSLQLMYSTGKEECLILYQSHCHGTAQTGI